MSQLFNPKIEQYCSKHSTAPSTDCKLIEDFTAKNVQRPQMMIGSLEGSFLAFLVSLVQARRILEIGCFTGYSALCMAERLPEDGELITLDVDADTVDFARRFWSQSPHGKKSVPSSLRL